ncbi:hypothetical protein N6G95_09430 [Pediococcus inopinatus]|uniref:hypothetical protein n=1 Tax=Pediococcus inopinatus TaxID=114090 RepID=UPI002B25AC09|nr:hypothetical protein [Pediococcus inopinatus]WPC19426.1 hypothetical protein N6G95_09430 [Pediococcus inopinatus]
MPCASNHAVISAFVFASVGFTLPVGSNVDAALDAGAADEAALEAPVASLDEELAAELATDPAELAAELPPPDGVFPSSGLSPPLPDGGVIFPLYQRQLLQDGMH